MSEAIESFMPKQPHLLFVTILIFGEPSKSIILWQKYKEMMGEGVLRHIPTYLHMPAGHCRMDVDNKVLLLLQEELEGMGTCLERFGLPTPDKEKRIYTCTYIFFNICILYKLVTIV